MLNACAYGDLEEVHFFLQLKDYDVNSLNFFGNTSLALACINGHADIVERLLNDSRVNPNLSNIENDTPFIHACREGHLAVITLLLNDNKVNVNHRNNNGMTGFLLACYLGDIELVKFLLKSDRVNANCEDFQGNNPLIISYQRKLTEIVALLLANERVDINHQNGAGKTAFYICCEKGDSDTFKKLVAIDKLNANIKDLMGTSPFLAACLNRRKEVVRLFLEENRLDWIIRKVDWLPIWRSIVYSISQDDDYRISSLLMADYRFKVYHHSLLALDRSIPSKLLKYPPFLLRYLIENPQQEEFPGPLHTSETLSAFNEAKFQYARYAVEIYVLITFFSKGYLIPTDRTSNRLLNFFAIASKLPYELQETIVGYVAGKKEIITAAKTRPIVKQWTDSMLKASKSVVPTPVSANNFSGKTATGVYTRRN